MTSSSYASPPRGLSFRAQLMFVLVTLTVSSTVVLGWLAYSTSRDIIEGNATQAVGVAANARRTALLQRLKRQQERAAAFLNTARTACRSEGGAQTTCLRQRLEEFANTEGSAAAQLAEGDTATVSVGEKSATLEHARPPAPDQLARFFFDDDRQPFYLIRAKSALEDASLTLLFGTQSINTIFADRNGLGESGETFLADAQGFFLTPPRYPSHSGHSHPIDAKPMQMCLSGRDSEVLDKDYRKADIIHGFRYVREIGGGCIMAHVDQAEAFAPAHALAVKVAGVATLFAALAVAFSFAFARLLARPFGELTARALALQAEDFASAPPINGPAEVQTFSRAFDAMARSISGSRAALVRSEERYRRLVELSPDGIIVHSEGLIIFANTAATLLLGASDASQLIGLPVIDLIHPDYRQVVEERGSQTREEGVTAPPLEEKFLRFDGTYLDVEARETTLNYEDRSAVQVVLRDTTKRKQSEQALVEQLRLAALGAEVGTALIQSDSLPDTLRRCAEIMVSRLDAAFARIWTLNEAGDVLELQASAGLYTHLDGPHARVLVGQFKIGLIARERVPRLTNDVQHDSRVSDKEWARREGMVAFAGYPLIVENRLVGVVALFARRALTQNTLDSLATVANGIALGIERKRIEEERARLLSSEQQARQTAEEANRTKDEFLATLSHELRTPLTSILGWARMLSAGQLNPATTARALDTIERNAKAQTQLIEDILDVSRVITGKLKLEVRPIDLAPVIESAVDSILPAADAKGIRLHRVLDSGGSTISGDPARMQQVVWNLLTNAIKFTPKGGRVQIRLERAHSHVEIIVSDTGLGIDADTLPHVFERFRQADSTSTRSHGGLGLGLAIVRHLVELHGGTVEAESGGPGQGATFTVRLPLIAMRSFDLTSAGGVGQAHPTASNDGVPFHCPPQLSGLHVMIVDDEEDTRHIVATVLEQCGARVTSAGSAAEAFTLFQAGRPDVLVSDLGMPGEDGYSLIKKVRALSAQDGGQIPAAALTAYARVEDRLKVMRAGFQIHIPKPVEPLELVTVVATLAGRNGHG